jgi:hypothetical protein
MDSIDRVNPWFLRLPLLGAPPLAHYLANMPASKTTDPNAKPKKPDPLDGLPQIERFKIVARELECDEDPAAFEAALQRIARHKPAKDEPRKRKNP